MMSAVLMFCIGTVQSVFILYGILDSFGGLMYAQDRQYMSELEHQTKTLRQDPSSKTVRGSSTIKHSGS